MEGGLEGEVVALLVVGITFMELVQEVDIQVEVQDTIICFLLQAAAVLTTQVYPRIMNPA